MAGINKGVKRVDKIRVLIADDIEETRNVIKKILNLNKEEFEVIGEAEDGEKVLELIPKVKPDIVLMDINMPVVNGLEATEIITEKYPWIIVIILSVQGENEYLRKAMFSGAKEYIIKPFNYEELVVTIKAAYKKYKPREKSVEINKRISRDANVITFFSSKGGVGKSVVTLNISVELSKLQDCKILLMDMDLLFGDIAMMVNQCNSKTILDVIDDGQIDTYESIKPYLYKYNENLDMLFAPLRPEAAEYIPKESVERIIKILQKEYDFILIDTGINFNDITLFLLDYARKIMFVTTSEIVSLKNAKLGLGVMKSLGYDKDKLELIVNRFTTSYGIKKSEIEEAFENNIFALIPEDAKAVNFSVNKGHPFCDNKKYSKLKIRKSIETISNKIFNGDNQ